MMANDTTTARGLGYLSLGLGFSQLLAPRWFSRTIGVRADSESETVVRLVGLREVVAGAGLLTSGNPAPWVWLRVGGDLMDLALLGRATTTKQEEPERLNGALASTVAITAVDLLSGISSAASGGSSNGNGGHANGHGKSQEMGGPGFLSDVGTKLRDGVMGGKPVRKAITIDRSANELYGYWRQLSNLPTFMRHLEDVRELDGGRSHWVATAPMGMTVEWDAEITDDVPNERISWRAAENASVKHEGTVRFLRAPGDRGTEVHVELTYQPPAGPVGVAIAKLFGEEPTQQVSEDLRRFKQVMETGTVIHSEATGGERRLRQRPAQPSPAGS
jgi:uncharacterized membrane protein